MRCLRVSRRCKANRAQSDAKGVIYTSPGQRPWWIGPKRSLRALKARFIEMRQAFGLRCIQILLGPRAMTWTGMSQAFGLKQRTPAKSKFLSAPNPDANFCSLKAALRSQAHCSPDDRHPNSPTRLAG